MPMVKCNFCKAFAPNLQFEFCRLQHLTLGPLHLCLIDESCSVSDIVTLHTFLAMLIGTSFHLVYKKLNKLNYFSLLSEIHIFWTIKQFYNSSLKTLPFHNILKTFVLDMVMVVMLWKHLSLFPTVPRQTCP